MTLNRCLETSKKHLFKLVWKSSCLLKPLTSSLASHRISFLYLFLFPYMLCCFSFSFSLSSCPPSFHLSNLSSLYPSLSSVSPPDPPIFYSCCFFYLEDIFLTCYLAIYYFFRFPTPPGSLFWPWIQVKCIFLKMPIPLYVLCFRISSCCFITAY